MIDRVVDALNRPHLQRSTVDEVIVSVCVVGFMIMFMFAVVAVQMFMEKRRK